MNPPPFQSLDVDLMDRALSLLVRRNDFQRFNLQLNLFSVQNPWLCFILLLSKGFHFNRVHALGEKTFLDNGTPQIFDFWKRQGLEFQRVRTLYDVPPQHLSNPLQVMEVEDGPFTGCEKVLEQFASGSPVLCFKKNLAPVGADQIWGFMHPFWPHIDILDHQTVIDGSESGFLIYGKKR